MVNFESENREEQIQHDAERKEEYEESAIETNISIEEFLSFAREYPTPLYSKESYKKREEIHSEQKPFEDDKLFEGKEFSFVKRVYPKTNPHINSSPQHNREDLEDPHHYDQKTKIEVFDSEEGKIGTLVRFEHIDLRGGQDDISEIHQEYISE